MKRIKPIVALTLMLVPTVVVVSAGPASAVPATVARYSFDAGASTTGVIASNSARGLPLKIRSSGGGAARFGVRAPGKYFAFPPRCAATATTCARLLLEGGDDIDLDPGTKPFRWGATINATAGQVGQSANVMQKGVASTESQWKLQIGGVRPRAQCVVVGVGSAKAYIARSDVDIIDGKWHQLTCLRSATLLAVVVDGSMRGKIALPSTLNISNAMPLRVGGPNLQATGDMYNGALDDVFAALG
jgi:hypothetical protein